MKNIPLKDFCDLESQYAAASVIGCTQGAISQAIKLGRRIYITEDLDGSLSYFEIKGPGSPTPPLFYNTHDPQKAEAS